MQDGSDYGGSSDQIHFNVGHNSGGDVWQCGGGSAEIFAWDAWHEGDEQEDVGGSDEEPVEANPFAMFAFSSL